MLLGPPTPPNGRHYLTRRLLQLIWTSLTELKQGVPALLQAGSQLCLEPNRANGAAAAAAVAADCAAAL